MLNDGKQSIWHTLGVLGLAVGVALVFSAWKTQPLPDGQSPTATASDTVEVSVGEGLSLSKSSLSAGTVTFRVTNDGSGPHGFAIAGPVEKAVDGEIAAGETSTLQATLDPGTYQALCPMDGHDTETAEFTVGQ